jgi:hypothetical protein
MAAASAIQLPAALAGSFANINSEEIIPMPQRYATWYGTPASSRTLTTLLAGGWGLSSAYIMFHSLLVTHDARLCIVWFVPMVIVWATLERKRWGRLALLGLSSTSLGLFVAGLGYVAAFGDSTFTPAQRDISHYSSLVIQMYSGAPTATYVTLFLAATTGFWMRLPAVVAEFERGKRVALAKAQQAIAFSLVACWAVTILFSTSSLKIPAALAATRRKAAGPRIHIRPHHSKRVSLSDAFTTNA